MGAESGVVGRFRCGDIERGRCGVLKRVKRINKDDVDRLLTEN